ncbi:cation efflux protein [Corynascus similis CBS 632.67]
MLTLSDKRRVSAAIAISSIFFVAELGVAFRTGSLALMADAFHYLNDVVGFVVTLASILVSEKTEYRQDFSFGWQRARLLGAFFNGSFLLALGVSIFLQSIERFVSPKTVDHVKLIFVMGCVGLGMNIVTAAFLHEHHHRNQHSEPDSEASPGTQVSAVSLHPDHARFKCCPKVTAVDSHADHRHVQRSFEMTPGRDLGMLGALLHVLGDALNNAGVMVAAAVIWFASSPSRFYADPAVGLGISLMILLSAVPLVKHSGEILLQSAPSGVSLGDIKHDLEKIPGIVAVHELHVWRLDQQKVVASAHLVISDPDITGFMVQARTIGECLHAYGIHSVTLQPELTPMVVAQPSPLRPHSSSSDDGLNYGNSGGSGGGSTRTEDDGCQIACGGSTCGHLMCCTALV